MRYRLMASYQGSPFEAGVGPTDGDIVLFAACPPPEALGFEPATGHWRKQVGMHEVQAVWEAKPVGSFRGERCMVLDDLGDRLHIGYLGHDGYRAEQLGYWQVDRGVFELVAPRPEVTGIFEERTAYQPVDQAQANDDYLPPAGHPEPYAFAAPPGGRGYQPAGADADEYAWRPDDPDQPASSYLTGPIPAYSDIAARPADRVSTAIPDDLTGVAVPAMAEPPLPLEAEALRATTAARRPPAKAAHPAAGLSQPARHGREIEQTVADLARRAGIPATGYAIGTAADNALCLVETENGYEVFRWADGSRHEPQTFSTPESACFYLFGVLAAEAVRSGTLAPVLPG